MIVSMSVLASLTVPLPGVGEDPIRPVGLMVGSARGLQHLTADQLHGTGEGPSQMQASPVFLEQKVVLAPVGHTRCWQDRRMSL